MPSPPLTEDLLDLKLLPAWVTEPPRSHDYERFGDDRADFDRPGAGRRPPRRGPDRDRHDRPPHEGRGRQAREQTKERSRRPQKMLPTARGHDTQRKGQDRPNRPPLQPLPVTVRFMPVSRAFDNVVGQIKSGLIAYSVFALARLFLEKPERYDVKLTAESDHPLFQLGENGAVASDRALLEETAFSNSLEDFYTTEVTQSEPLKGNFTNVARCRLSGTLLGPTNHHNYQPQLRTLFETRFSRRMSFVNYQNQIEIVSDPAVVEEWKEQARNVTTYTTKKSDPPVSFNNLGEVERHFRKNHLPELIRTANELVIDGVVSRRLQDRVLGRTIEEAWANETRSPAKMMQELTTRFRQASLNIFRHRRGMLFVSPVRPRVFSHESTGVSPSINAILERVTAVPGINRKQLAEQLAPASGEPADLEKAKLTLASDLHWLVSCGYVVEFNDTSLDLPRVKAIAIPVAEGNSEATAERQESTARSEHQPIAQPKIEVAIEPLEIPVIAAEQDRETTRLGGDSSSMP